MAHKAQLTIETLQQSATAPPPDVAEVEKKQQDALVRLGSAEQRALQAQQHPVKNG